VKVKFSFIIPVYNRPDELKELLESFKYQSKKTLAYEIIIVDDGSTVDLLPVIQRYENLLPLRYMRKKNSGPGHSRNIGMQEAKGKYFVILDSDVILPDGYLQELNRLEEEDKLAAAGGGADMSRNDFSSFIRAVDLAMTSFSTTGGIRGKKRNMTRYVPRSFNMIVRRDVFKKTGGFGNMHPGEDPEWIYRIWEKGFASVFYPSLPVFHKRRSNWKSFWKQMNKFGIARGILNRAYPQYASAVYYFPAIYSAGLILASLLAAEGRFFLLYLYIIYWLIILAEFLWRSKSIRLSLLAWLVFQVQMFAYATGLIRAVFMLYLLRKSPAEAFPFMFFKKRE